MKRRCGVLLPVSSLPSPYGVGSFGQAAYEWVDFLAAARQSYWQVLPLGPTGYGDSPYQSFSAFAGSPYYIDLDLLCEQGLLTPEECAAPAWAPDACTVDYGALYKHRAPLLHKAFARFSDGEALAAFRAQNAHWVEDYALYMAVKASQGGCSWTQWPAALRLRRPAAIAEARQALAEEIAYYIFEQYVFFTQWKDLKAYAGCRGIEIIGDAPIYVAMDSADTWSRPELFLLNEEGLPIDVAGCPPDAFSADGQLWGNPLYRWDVLKETGYAWWLQRLESSFTLFDIVRIDHFRGFESYYAIPYGAATARNGEWRKGPDVDFVRAVQARFGRGGIIAEDLGFLTPAVHKLLKASGYPGMKVLQFAFDAREESDYMPHNYRPNCVVYTGTHDNDTTAGWLQSARRADVRCALDYLGVKRRGDAVPAFIRAALSSVADLAVIPMQDWLNLGSEARINTPSTLGGNWVWRMEAGACTPELAKHMAHCAKLYGRAPKKRKGRA